MLWQRLANQERINEVGEHLESTSQQLSSVSKELESRSAKEAVQRLQNTMTNTQKRVLMRVFNRWSCLSASLHENEVVTLAKDKEREATVADLQSKIANYNAGSAEGALYSALATMYKNLSTDTIYRKRATEVPIHFWLYTLRTSMPFGIFNVEFMDEAKKYNHVKVDIYSAALDNEDDRRSFVIWQKDDPKNYKFFVDNFNDIKQNRTLCTRHRSFEKLKKWAQEWDNMKPGGLN